MKNSKLRRFIYLIYGHTFFNNLTLLYPLYAIMFKDSGVNDTQIALLLILWSVSSIIFQIPVGLIADKYSRKNVIIVGGLLKAACFLVWIFIPNFWGFLLGFTLWGIQWATINVCEAYIYDELKIFKKRSLYTRVCGKNHSVGILGYIVSSTGSFLLFLGYDIISYLSVASLLISVVLLWLTQPTAKATPASQTKYMKIVKFGVRILVNRPQIFFLMFILTLMMGLAYIDEYFGLIGLEMGFRTEYVGIIFISVLLSESLGSWIAHKFDGKKIGTLYFGIFILGAIFISIYYFYNFFGVIILSFFYFLYSILRVLMMSKFQHMIESKTRATVLSFLSVFEQMSCIISYTIMMISAAMGSYKYGFLMLGSIISVVSIIYWMIDRNAEIKINLQKQNMMKLKKVQ